MQYCTDCCIQYLLILLNIDHSVVRYCSWYCSTYCVIFWPKLSTELLMIYPHIVQYCSTYSSMSDISRLMQASPPLSHFFASALQNNHRAALPGSIWCPSQLWPVPGLAPLWSQHTAAPRCGSGCHDSLAFPSYQYLTTVLVHLYSLRAVYSRNLVSVLANTS